MTEISLVIVEDHDLTRVGLEAALQRRNGLCVVGEAANGLQGLRLIQVEKPDIAIIDIGLPDIDGIELVRRVRKSQTEEKTGKTKILMLTMHKIADSVLASFAAGADSYCMKDVDVDHLEEAIRATHAGYPWIDPQIASIVLQQFRKYTTDDQSISGKTINIKALDPEYEEIVDKAGLTDREIEILQHIVQGSSNAQISSALYVTVGTVKTHIRHILNKLCVDDRTHAAVLALRAGIIK